MSDVELLWQQITIADIVDIILISILIYQFLAMIRGTRGVQIGIGLSAIAVLFMFSVTFDLFTIKWVLEHFFNSFVLIMAILFQDSIRLALSRIGRVNFFNRLTGDQNSDVVDEIVEVSHALKEERTGAIIVIERENGLLNYAQTGTIINAKVHSDLIYSIFQNRSPLHDGALIISHDKILAAGCFLPLIKNVLVEKRQGTRHRAALGLSSLTDALVVVISEERGEIALAQSGTLRKIESASELREKLLDLMYSRKNIVSVRQREKSVKT